MRRRSVPRRVCCVVLSLLLLSQTGLFCFAQDTFLNPESLNYSTTIARTQTQLQNVYSYLSRVMSPAYVPRVYDLIYRAQFRLTMNGGTPWPYWNDGETVTQIADSVIGTQIIYPAKGCNAYARYAAQYIRKTQGVLYRASTYFGKEETFVPTAAQIHTFVSRFADTGERILTGYYNATAREIRPHSLLFLAQDPQEEGFYFLCQDGDRNGQTLRYITYTYLARILRYFDKYGYSLAVGETNSGRDAAVSDPIYSETERVSPQKLVFSKQTGTDLQVSGWAIHREKAAFTVSASADGKPLADGVLSARADLEKLYPGCLAREFTVQADLSALGSGEHTVIVTATDGKREHTLWSGKITIDDLVHTAETPAESSVRLSADAPSLHLTGWAYDRAGVPMTFFYAINGEKPRALTSQPRPEVRGAYPDCAFDDVGYDLTLTFPTNVSANYKLDVFARIGENEILLRSIAVYVETDQQQTVYPTDVQLHSLPETTIPFGGTLRKEQISLDVTYSDGSKRVVKDGFTCTDIRADLPGTQTVYVQFDAFTCSFDVLVLSPMAPREVHIEPSAQMQVARRQTLALEVMTDPEEAEGYTVRWTSSDPAVATVDDAGVVTGVSIGRCSITIDLLDSAGGVLCTDTVQIRVCSAFRLWLQRLWERIQSVFNIRIHVG